jgi:arsenate reductase-like glutaredoxin family protein
MNEYQAGVTNSVSIMEKKAPAPVNQNVGPTQKTNNPVKEFGSLFDASLGTVQDNSSASDVIKAIANSVTAKSARHKALAEALLPFADVNTKVSVGDTKNTFGAKTAGIYDPSTDRITIDSGLSSEKKEGVFIHELVHAITLRDLKKYYEVDTDGFYTILKDSAPDHVRQLDSVWKLYIENTDPELREKAKQKTLDLRAKKPVVFTPQEREIGYPSVDIFEFLAVAMESEEFQKHLNSIQLPGGQTLLEKFIETIKTILTEIGVEVKKGSLAEKSLNDILNFMQVEAEIKEESATFATIEIDSDSLEQELYERALMEQETTEQEFEEDIDLEEDSSEEAPEESLLPYTSEITDLGISEEEWSNLSEEEKQNIKECN